MSEKQTVKFGDICREVKLTTKNPIADGYDKYIGLDHLDSSSLKIKRWGSIAEDNPSFTRVFKKGHILFGKRRPYLKKAAIAEFDGICSGDIIVMEPKESLILESFLPRVIQTNQFWDWAIKTSSGSLSPRTKFKSLEGFEFSLLPKDRQINGLNIFNSLDLIIQRNEECLVSAEKLFKTLLLNQIWDKQNEWDSYRISDLGSVKLGRQRAPKFMTGKYFKPYLRVINVLDGELDLIDVEEMDFSDSDFNNHLLLPGDILITEGDITSVFNVGRSAIYRGEIENCCFQNTLIRFRAGPKVIPEFAHYLFRAAFYQGVFAHAANMTTVAHLGADRFSKIRISAPPIKTQKFLCKNLISVEASIKELKNKINEQSVIKHSLSKEFLGIE
jgi:type I restriction enzyme S subunit